ncbi:MULE and SWIM domain-containing protein [Phanerochaete sordida]|uniref:MULE and SWIM domain-containing protein n=1 Tax=Phanerochaete sordida TaxID=48140 RepID=A0A9P3G427_9APHY|nr:MULE and SWIM domain-containing protein [Phanerochaete sordida]
MADVRRIHKGIEAESIRLHRDDGISMLRWVEKLRETGSVLAFKSVNSPPPEDSGLAADTFVLCIQTDRQREIFKKYGAPFAAIDGTHNTTQYKNINLYTILVRDRYGHGIPVAWMLASSGTQETLDFYLRTFRQANPGISPKWLMTDCDQAQINALRAQFPDATILLCWWHVLHAWQQHFVTTAFPDLWQLLKQWIRISDESGFEAHWAKIRQEAPQSFIEYLELYWLPRREMWSAMHRKNRDIFEKNDTNMLLEAYHHVLKGMFLEHKRNRRVDNLIYTLITHVLPHYYLRLSRQEHGFEGDDLELQERRAAALKALSILRESISSTGEAVFSVASQSTPGTRYSVNLDDYTCSCPAYPLVSFCKHIAAVQAYFPEDLPEALFGVEIPHCTNGDRPSDAAQATQQPLPAVSSPVLAPADHQNMQKSTALIQDLQRLMENLAAALQDVLGDTAGLLPPAMKIAPNQHSWTETAQTMIGQIKRTKRKITDAYAGGESSGKKAKSDAKKPRLSGISSVSQAQQQPAPGDAKSTSNHVPLHPQSAQPASLPPHAAAPPPAAAYPGATWSWTPAVHGYHFSSAPTTVSTRAVRTSTPHNPLIMYPQPTTQPQPSAVHGRDLTGPWAASRTPSQDPPSR